MSGISSIGSGSLPNAGLSSVGESLLTTGQAPNAAPAASPAPSGTLSSYQAQYLSLQAYDNQELLYASFLPQSEALANADSVFAQAAALLGAPGRPASQSSLAASAPATTQTSSTSSRSSALPNLPSVSSILAASDDEANQTLNAYAGAPVGSSIIDYQA